MDQDVTWYGSIGLNPSDIVLDETSSPPQKRDSLQFSAHVYCAQTAGWTKMSLGVDVGLGPGNIVLVGTQLPLPNKGQSPPTFGPCLLSPNGWMNQDAT